MRINVPNDVPPEKEKELTDSALKLAEVAKPKSNWELQGLLGLAAVLLGFLAGK